jgi:hypothetical protein
MYGGKTPDDGQRNCPKHVEFLDKNKFGKLVRLVVLLKRNFSCSLPVANAYNDCFAKTVCGSCSMLRATEQPVQHGPSLAICLPVVRTYVQYLTEDPLTTAQEANFLGTKNLQHLTY